MRDNTSCKANLAHSTPSPGPIHLADAFLKHFATKKHAVIMNVTSVLGFIPFSIINPTYNGTKAFLHFYTMAQRVQLKETNIKVVEIIPPQVHTALHRDREDPDVGIASTDESRRKGL